MKSCNCDEHVNSFRFKISTGSPMQTHISNWLSSLVMQKQSKNLEPIFSSNQKMLSPIGWIGNADRPLLRIPFSNHCQDIGKMSSTKIWMHWMWVVKHHRPFFIGIMSITLPSEICSTDPSTGCLDPCQWVCAPNCDFHRENHRQWTGIRLKWLGLFWRGEIWCGQTSSLC